MTRRRFAAQAGRVVLAGLGLAAAAGSLACGGAGDGDPLIAALRSLPARRSDAAAVARSLGWSAERARAVLDLAPAALEEPARFQAALGRRIRGDFVAGRVVSADGWRLSETEAAAAVLLAAGS